MHDDVKELSRKRVICLHIIYQQLAYVAWLRIWAANTSKAMDADLRNLARRINDSCIAKSWLTREVVEPGHYLPDVRPMVDSCVGTVFSANTPDSNVDWFLWHDVKAYDLFWTPDARRAAATQSEARIWVAES